MMIPEGQALGVSPLALSHDAAISEGEKGKHGKRCKQILWNIMGRQAGPTKILGQIAAQAFHARRCQHQQCA